VNPQLKLLISLHDIDLEIKYAGSHEGRTAEEELGFTLADPSEVLRQAREEVAKKLDPQLLKRYELLLGKYGRAVAHVIRGVCLGCYIHLPTAEAHKKDKNDEVSNCSNCGRFLYWMD
jgi:predicted  nucleic acid-binding Zn-ribbon protein